MVGRDLRLREAFLPVWYAVAMLAMRAARAFDGQELWPYGALVFVDDGRIVGVEAAGAAVPDGSSSSTSPRHVAGARQRTSTCAATRERRPGAPAGALGRPAAVIETALAQQLASGVTTVRDRATTGGRSWTVATARCEPRSHIVASGPPITSVGGHCWMMGGEVAGERPCGRVRERAERRVDVVKVMASGGNMTPGTDITACQFTLEERRGVVEEAHGLGLPVTAHAHALAAVEQAVEAGVDGIEHCTCLTPDGVELSEDLLRRLREREIVVCPTLGKARDAVLSPRILEMLARFGMTLESRQELFAAVLAAGVQVSRVTTPASRRGSATASSPRPSSTSWPVGAVTDALISATSSAARAGG